MARYNPCEGRLAHTGRPDEHFDRRHVVVWGREGSELLGERALDDRGTGGAGLKCRMVREDAGHGRVDAACFEPRRDAA